MGLFSRHRKITETYDATRYTPAIRSSICTGEQTAGFREKGTGSFREVMLIRDDSDLLEFKRRYGIDGPVETFY